MTDIHGSDRCFRKFINAAKFYRARYLILGGDITGKVMIPIVERNNGTWEADYLGERKEFNKEEKIKEFEKTLSDGGIYSLRLSSREYEEIGSSSEKVDTAFSTAMKLSLQRWMNLASERLKDSDTTCFISVGNDDDFVVDQVLSTDYSNNIVFCEEIIVRLDGHEMLSLGTSNRTPWNSPREADEETLKKKLGSLVEKIENPEKSIFSIHVPPIDSGIDSAHQIDENFKPVLKGGQPVMIGVGSTAVRECIQVYKPLLGLHGQIHESRGIYKLGKTICINPGSEYGQGILRGALVDLEEEKVSDYLLVSG